MAITRANTFESGQTVGTSLTTANTAVGGDAFQSITLGGGCVFDNAHVLHGALACKYTNTGANVATQWQTIGMGLTNSYFRTHCYYSAAPAGNARLFSFQNVAATVMAICYINASRQFIFADTGGSAILTSTILLPLNAWFRIEGWFFPSATVGQAEYRIFLSPDSTTIDETKTSAATFNTAGTTGVDRCSAGPSSTVAITYWLDDVALSDQGYIGPAGAGILPQQAKHRAPALFTRIAGRRPVAVYR